MKTICKSLMVMAVLAGLVCTVSWGQSSGTAQLGRSDKSSCDKVTDGGGRGPGMMKGRGQGQGCAFDGGCGFQFR